MGTSLSAYELNDSITHIQTSN